MKIELIFYRLAFLIVLVSGVGGAGMSAYSYLQSDKWQDTVDSTYDAMNQGYADCEDDPRSLSCGWIQDRQEAFGHSVNERDRHAESGYFWFKFSLVVPFVVVFIFYSFRWIFTGRLLPILIGRKNG